MHYANLSSIPEYHIGYVDQIDQISLPVNITNMKIPHNDFTTF